MKQRCLFTLGNRCIPLIPRPIAALGLVLAIAAPAHAARLPPLDKAWTEQCVSLRKASKNLQATVRNYCVCMQELIGAGGAFDSAAAMESAHPRAHRSCRRKAGMRPG
jgi:hypothetical protein